MDNTKVRPTLKDRSYQLSVSTIQFLDSLPKDASTQIISKQLLRSSTSIGANIVEAQAGSSGKDFANFFSYALKSANETVYWLGLLRDAKKISNPRLDSLLNESKELANILASNILTIRKRYKSKDE